MLVSLPETLVKTLAKNSARSNCYLSVTSLCMYVYCIHTSVDLSLYSDIVSEYIARRSDLKLWDSMFCLCILSSIFSMDGRSWSWRAACFFFDNFSSTSSMDSRSRSWLACVGGLRSFLGPLCAVLMLAVCWRSWDLCWRSWAALGPLRAVLGRPGGLYRRSWLHLGGAWRVCCRSWASTGGPGPLLGPLCAVLGRSWSLCWRSWATLGAYVGGLGPLLGPKTWSKVWLKIEQKLSEKRKNLKKTSPKLLLFFAGGGVAMDEGQRRTSGRLMMNNGAKRRVQRVQRKKSLPEAPPKKSEIANEPISFLGGIFWGCGGGMFAGF